MDPGALLQKEIQKNLPKFGNIIRKKCTYNSNPDPSYNPDDDTLTPGTPGIQENVWIIFDNFSASAVGFDYRQEDDERVLQIDQVAIIAYLDLLFQPKAGDTIEKEGILYSVRAWKEDPASATWTLHVRPTKPATP